LLLLRPGLGWLRTVLGSLATLSALIRRTLPGCPVLLSLARPVLLGLDALRPPPFASCLAAIDSAFARALSRRPVLLHLTALGLAAIDLLSAGAFNPAAAT